MSQTKNREQQKALINTILFLMLIIGGIVSSFIGDKVNWFLLALSVCGMYYPLKTLYLRWNLWCWEPVRRIKKALPEVGFEIADQTWNDEHNQTEISGTFKNRKFVIRAWSQSQTITLLSEPWFGVRADDPQTPKFIEAINEVNTYPSFVKLIMPQADEGMKIVASVVCAPMPGLNLPEFLSVSMSDMIEREAMFAEVLRKNENRASQRPVGFNIQTESPAQQQPSENAKDKGQ